MADKLYASQWLKIGGSNEWQNHSVKMAAQTAALKLLEKPELDILFQLVEQQSGETPWGKDEFTVMLDEAFGVKRTFEELRSRDLDNWIASYVSGNSTLISPWLVRHSLLYFFGKKDYDHLLVIGACVHAHKPRYLTMYVDAMLELLQEYRYGKGTPANPVSCLIGLGPEVAMKVEAYFKKHTLPDAQRRWNEFRQAMSRSGV